MAWILDTVLQPDGPIGPNAYPKVAVSGTTIAVAWSTALDVYTKAGGTWTPTRVVSGGECRAVALDADTLALGLTGEVRMFSRSNGTWTAGQTLLPPTPEPSSEFGLAVALRGNVLAVGDQSLNDNVGQVVVYDRVGATWSSTPTIIASIPDAQECYPTPADQHFGAAVALTRVTVGGNQVDRLIVGKPDAGQACANYPASHPGHAYVFERTNLGAWTLQATLASPEPGAGFGYAVAVAGDTIFVSGTGEMSGFRKVGATWTNFFTENDSDLELPVCFDGATLAFGADTDIDPYAAGANGSLFPQPTVPLSSSGALSGISVDGGVLAAGDEAAQAVSVFKPGLLLGHLPHWAAINPLVLVLGDQAFVRLKTLPDPPPIEILNQQLAVGIARMTRQERRTAARALAATTALLSDVRRALERSAEAE